MTTTDPTVPSTAPQPAQEPDHIIADTDQVEASILAEFEVSPLRDLALDLLHDLVQTRAEVRRLRAELDAAPAAPTTYALPAEPPPEVTELWEVRTGRRWEREEFPGYVRWRSEDNDGEWRGWLFRQFSQLLQRGPLSTVPPAGTAVAVAVDENGTAYLDDDTEVPAGEWEPAGTEAP